MRTLEVIKKAGKSLDNNTTPAIALSVAAMILFACLFLVGVAAAMFFDTLFFYLPRRELALSLIGLVAMLLAATLTYMPFRLGVKRWYFRLERKTTLTGAFGCFRSLREYTRAVRYSMAKLLLHILLLLSAIMPNVAMTMFILHYSSTNTRFSLFLVSVIAFAFANLVVLWVAGYIFTGTFFCDYMFANQREQKISELFLHSFEMMRGKRIALIKLLFSQIPNYIISLPIATMLFTLPQIDACYAAFAKEQLQTLRGGQNVDIK